MSRNCNDRLMPLFGEGWPVDEQAVALLAPGRAALTYGGLLRQIDLTMAALNEAGIGRNDRVAIVLENGPEMASAFVAIASAATCAPLNPAYRREEFDFYLSDLNAVALVIGEGVDSPARSVAAERGIPVIELCVDPAQPAGVFTLACLSGGAVAKGGFAEVDDIAMVLHTSGTTSRPKIVPLSVGNLRASADNIRRSLRLVAEDRCLNVMPLFHIHGLVGALLSSLSAGASVICTPGFFAPRFMDWIDTMTPTWYTAVPSMHAAIVGRAREQADIIARRRLRFIRSSSSALAPQLMAELEAVFHTPVIEAYGMTEASHQMASNPLPPGKRKPGSVGIAAGPEIAIMDAGGSLLGAKETGEIVIRGQSVTAGYENNPEANAGAFTNGWFRTGDQGYLDAEKYLYITGRLKELINRGGEKISPREIDEVLLDHPAVAQAVTFAMPDAALGEAVGAAVVLRAGITATERQIREFVALHLADFKVPERVLILDEIPKGPTGKIQRIGLAAKLGLTGAVTPVSTPAVEFVAPRNAVEEGIASIWRGVLGIETVGIHDNFLHAGGDSVLLTQCIARIRESFNAEVSVIDFFEGPTIAQLAARVAAAQLLTSRDDDLRDVLADVENLSEEEAARLLEEEA